MSKLDVLPRQVLQTCLTRGEDPGHTGETILLVGLGTPWSTPRRAVRGVWGKKGLDLSCYLCNQTLEQAEDNGCMDGWIERNFM